MSELTYRELYERFNERGGADAVNEAFDAVQEILKSHNLNTANDDRAERLVTEITRYVYESGNMVLGPIVLDEPRY